MITQTLHGIPPSRLDTVIRGFEAQGFTVASHEQADGNFTVVATKGAAASTIVSTVQGDTVVLNNVPASALSKVVKGLTAQGYTVTVQPEDDGEFTVIGVKR